MTIETRQSAKVKKCLRDYEDQLGPYREARFTYSIWQLSSTFFLFAGLWAATSWSLHLSFWFALVLAVPTGLVLVRLFIFQHDCGHRSFFDSKRANDLVGSILGIITFTPYHAWRREHASHHATSGDLDRRGRAGDLWTLTVDEYREASRWRRFSYRLYRNPLVLFGIGPVFHFVIYQRFASLLPKTWKRERKSVHFTNLALIAYAVTLSLLMGPWNFLIVQLLVIGVASSVGVWMFYVQHQFEDAFWESGESWDYVQAALDGSSHYRLPKILQWFTGNIGLHHIHHLDLRIPNYNLQSCHDNNPEFQQVNEFSLLNSMSCIKAKLWDERQQKMVGFAAVD